MCGAIVTAPLDVVKTRLQSSLYHDAHRVAVGTGPGGVIISRARNLLWNFVETGHILRYARIRIQDVKAVSHSR